MQGEGVAAVATEATETLTLAQMRAAVPTVYARGAHTSFRLACAFSIFNTLECIITASELVMHSAE